MKLIRSYIGVLLRDSFHYRFLLGRRSENYLKIRNPNEMLELAPDHSGYRCNWQWTSDLYAPKVIPALGRLLIMRALAVNPIRRVESPKCETGFTPQVTFLIGHRGMARLPHLLATLKSIAAQQGPSVECIVIEQDTVSQLGPLLPAWVRLVHTPPPDPDMPYCRSWTFNVGAQLARTDILVLHDNDILVPFDYAASILIRVQRGYDVVNLKRFIFYLTQSHTKAFLDGEATLRDAAPEVIVQNSEGGGSVAITRAGYDQIGGMDESFIGWGGEDNEFWERAQTLRVWPWANLPMVHLWHAAQPGKHEPNNPIWAHYHFCSSIPPNERIAHLRLLNQGNTVGPYRY